MLDWFLNDWPEGENGEPEEEAFLGNEAELDSGTGEFCSYLSSCGIPFVTRLPDGEDPPAGRDIFVPLSFLNDAQELLHEAEEFAFDYDF